METSCLKKVSLVYPVLPVNENTKKRKNGFDMEGMALPEATLPGCATKELPRFSGFFGSENRKRNRPEKDNEPEETRTKKGRSMTSLFCA
jgi:hypothetical protein